MKKRKHPHSPPTATLATATTRTVIVRNGGPCTKKSCRRIGPHRVGFISIPRPPFDVAIHEDEIEAWATREGVTIIWQT